MVKLYYLDTCLPDYFQGFSGHVYAIPVDNLENENEIYTTKQDILEGLLDSIKSEEIINIQESDYKEIEKQALAMFDSEDMDSLWSNIMVGDSSNHETIYAYFGVKLEESGS